MSKLESQVISSDLESMMINEDFARITNKYHQIFLGIAINSREVHSQWLLVFKSRRITEYLSHKLLRQHHPGFYQVVYSPLLHL